jgi:hypothetical protein
VPKGAKVSYLFSDDSWQINFSGPIKYKGIEINKITQYYPAEEIPFDELNLSKDERFKEANTVAHKFNKNREVILNVLTSNIKREQEIKNNIIVRGDFGRFIFQCVRYYYYKGCDLQGKFLSPDDYILFALKDQIQKKINHVRRDYGQKMNGYTGNIVISLGNPSTH